MVRLLDSEFTALFHAHFPRLRRYLARLSGDPDLAADLAQEAFVRLYRRGDLPEAPGAWLVTVAMNLLRNTRNTRARRQRLLDASGGADVLAVAPSPLEDPDAGVERGRVRATLARLAERDQQLLLLRAEGYSYRDMAQALALNEASVGTLLARAKEAFRRIWEGNAHAP